MGKGRTPVKAQQQASPSRKSVTPNVKKEAAATPKFNKKQSVSASPKPASATKKVAVAATPQSSAKKAKKVATPPPPPPPPVEEEDDDEEDDEEMDFDDDEEDLDDEEMDFEEGDDIFLADEEGDDFDDDEEEDFEEDDEEMDLEEGDEEDDEEFDFDEEDDEDDDRLDDEAFAAAESAAGFDAEAASKGIGMGMDLMSMGKKKQQKAVAAPVAPEKKTKKVDEKPAKKDSKKVVAAQVEGSDDEEAEVEDGEDLDENFVATSMVEELLMAQKRNAAQKKNSRNPSDTRDIIRRTVEGSSGSNGIGAAGRGNNAAIDIDPLSTSGLALGSAPLLQDFADQRAQECSNEDALLDSAHKYFSELNRTEKKRNKEAMRKINEMKKVNKAGGDKDGFQFVLPTNTQQYAKRLAEQEANGGVVVDSENLESHFQGDGEKDNKPMRRMKARKHFKDDFYAFQVAKKWTKNAESFLSRGRAHRNMFAERAKQRNANKL